MIKKHFFTILVSIAIFWLSMSNSDNFEFEKVKLFESPQFDKLVHIGMYFMLMTSILYENRREISKTRGILTSAIFPLSYGFIIELLQSFTATRSSSFYDLLADVVGIIISIILWKLFRPREVIK